jgi:hypothetical protein
MSYCCPCMKDILELVCDSHPEDACPDQIIVPADNGGLAIPIHDGGHSAIGIDYCPWCATPATVDAWTRKTQEAGADG